MRTFKVIGGGLLAGQVFYGQVLWCTNEELVAARLDDGGAVHYFNADTGLVVVTGDVNADYLQVDPYDLPVLQQAWREVRGEKPTLEKLTDAEVERMRNIYATGPLTRRPIDDSLEQKGWVQWYDDDPSTNAMEPSWAAYGKKGIDDPTKARCVLYQRNGCVHPYWRIS